MGTHRPPRNIKERIEDIIFRHDTAEGKTFDIILLALIILSIILIMMESVKGIDEKYHAYLTYADYVITALFTIEYVARIWTVEKRWGYVSSFYGVIDLLSILPTYLGFFLVGTSSLSVIRALRLLRVFRILKLGRFMMESQLLMTALKASRPKITVFLFVIITLVTIIGTLMYLIEGDENGFTSIPTSMYWAIVTLTTVGYGDITPQSPLGQIFSSLLMLMGYGVIAVPTGIVSAEIANTNREYMENIVYEECDVCNTSNLPPGAKYCHNCGNTLD